jgi:LacI family gluconate utilization system Gnt-I transcriptional repressor
MDRDGGAAVFGGMRVRKRRGNGRPTIADVAERAGVGKITVSRALRNPEQVSESLRSAIDDAVRALNYTPNLNARALASARNDLIGVLVPALTANIFTDVLRGIYDGVEETNLRVEIANTRYDKGLEERRILDMLRHKPAGLIVSGVDQTPAARRALAAAECPVVQIMDLTDDPVDRVIGFSHAEGGRRMTAHLVAAGYRRIAFLGGYLNDRSSGRLKGHRDVLEAAGLYTPDLVCQLDSAPPSTEPGNPDEWVRFSSPAAGRDLLTKALDTVPGLDAVFCNNDMLAMGALFECQRRGIRVPQDIGIAGFNDLEPVAAAEPGISSCRTPRWQCGHDAVHAIRDALDGASGLPSIVDLGVEVIARGSTQRAG